MEEMKVNILFTICGRAGSKGLKNKNIADFNGIPLPYYTLAVISMYCEKHRKEFERMDLALSTDSKELRAIVETKCPVAYCIDRDASLAGDSVRKIDVIRDAAARAEKHFQTEYDMVVDLDITSPLRTLEDLEHVIEKRLQVDADVVYTVTPARRNPYFNQVMKHEDGYFRTVCGGQTVTRQAAPQIYDMNASIYAYTPAYIHGTEPTFKRADIVIMRDTGFLDIDNAEDHEYMQIIAEHLCTKHESYRAVKKYAAEL